MYKKLIVLSAIAIGCWIAVAQQNGGGPYPVPGGGTLPGGTNYVPLTNGVITTPTFPSSNIFQGGIIIPNTGLTVDSTSGDVNPSHNPQLSFRASPYSSGGGVNIYSTGTNSAGGTKYAAAGTTNFYSYDQYAVSYVVAGQQASKGLLPGVATEIVNGAPMAFASTLLPGGLSAGNYPLLWIDSSNSAVVFPKLTSGKFFPYTYIYHGLTNTADGGPAAMTVHNDTGNVEITNTLTVGNNADIRGNLTLPHASFSSNGVTISVGDTANTNGTFNGWKYLTTRTAQTYSGPTFQVNDSGEGIGNYGAQFGGVGVYTVDDATNTPAIRVDNHFSGNQDQVTIKSNLVVNGEVTSLGGFTSPNTNQFAIAATGWTNTNAFNCMLYITNSGAAYTYSDGTNTILSGTIVASTLPIGFAMHPSWKVTAASGLAGKAVPY